MGFDYNPLEHIEIVREDGKFKLMCHNCGGEFEAFIPDSVTSSFQRMKEHVIKSHNYRPQDFEGWSIR